MKEFVAAFQRYVREDAIFISTLEPRPPGAEIAFVILLADGTPVLRGSCRVRDSWTTNDNAFGLPGVLLAIKELSPRSKTVFQQLRSARNDETQVQSPPPPARTGTTRQYFLPLPRPASPGPEPTGDEFECFEQPTRLAAIPPPLEAMSSSPVAIPRVRQRFWRLAWLVPVAAAAAVGVAAVASTASRSSAEIAAPVASPPPVPPAAPPRIAMTTAGEGPCRLEVTTTPGGASVAIDGKVQGTTPLAIATSCGQHRVDISHPQYQPITAWAPLSANQPEAIDLVLPRPIHALAVVSHPAGARILIDGHVAGTTPTMLSVLGYVPLALEIDKPGFRRTVEHVYSTTPRDTLTVQLVKP